MIPHLGSVKPRPHIAPSTSTPPNGFSRSVPCQCSLHPSTWTVSVWPMNRSRLPSLRPVRVPQIFGRPDRNSSVSGASLRFCICSLRNPTKLASFPVMLLCAMAPFSKAIAFFLFKAASIRSFIFTLPNHPPFIGHVFAGLKDSLRMMRPATTKLPCFPHALS